MNAARRRRRVRRSFLSSNCKTRRIDVMYESSRHPLLSPAKFMRRVARHALLGLIVIAIALGIGIFGYHFIGRLGWIDSLLNASMILGGMGPVDPLKSD